MSADYVAWLNSPEVTRFSEQRHVSHTLESCRTYVARASAPPHRLWAIELREGDLHIGNLSATLDNCNGVADIGILLGHPEGRGRGFGRAAWELALASLLAAGLRKITGGCMEVNVPMMRIMKACDMTEDGRRRAHALLEGRPVDIVHFAFWNPEVAVDRRDVGGKEAASMAGIVR